MTGDASQDLRCVEPSGTVVEILNGGTGSNDGIGAGSVGDFDGDGTVAVATVSGSNEIKLVGAPGGEGVRTFFPPTLGGGLEAAKSPVSVADVDGDDEDEVVYVENSAPGELYYLDDIQSTPTVRKLVDDNGDRIGGSKETGVT